MQSLRSDADRIISSSIQAVLPDAAVENALKGHALPSGKTVLIAAGKAAWQMAAAAKRLLGDRVSSGAVITKYGHSKGEIDRLEIYEAGHPVPDSASFSATERAIELVSGLSCRDEVIFLLSGGGSALFEKPLIEPGELAEITQALLSGGADICEINTVRKRFSAVKGGRFAELCLPASVFAVVLSDVLGDQEDMIASGPVSADRSSSAEAEAIAEKYGLKLSRSAAELIKRETPKSVKNATVTVTGSVRRLCAAAADCCAALGYRPVILTDSLCCTARDAGSFLASIAACHQKDGRSIAFLAGGETVVRVTGGGRGGRCQELALAAAGGIAGFVDTAVFAFGSDGTDGPTDAAGGYCDGRTALSLAAAGISPNEALDRNDAYSALAVCDGLIFTGPTGTNVNDLAVVLIKR